jgi:hypothetical protein
LPLERTLPKLRAALKPNGVLLVLDLYQAEGLKDGMLDLLAVPVHSVLKLKHTGRIREPKEVREAWAAHGVNDTYLRVSDVRRTCNQAVEIVVLKY